MQDSETGGDIVFARVLDLMNRKKVVIDAQQFVVCAGAVLTPSCCGTQTFDRMLWVSTFANSQAFSVRWS